MKMYRQGDVLVVERNAPNAEALKPVDRDNGRVVLAYGEVTGHAHAIFEPAAVLFADIESGRRFLKSDKQMELRHEEHSTIILPPGDYEVIRQVEYTPAGLRTVAD